MMWETWILIQIFLIQMRAHEACKQTDLVDHQQNLIECSQQQWPLQNGIIQKQQQQQQCPPANNIKWRRCIIHIPLICISLYSSCERIVSLHIIYIYMKSGFHVSNESANYRICDLHRKRFSLDLIRTYYAFYVSVLFSYIILWNQPFPNHMKSTFVQTTNMYD